MAEMTADVTVHGAGAFGLSVAWACLRRGAKLRVIDPFGAGAGSSGGLVGALAPHVPENWNEKKAFQLDSLLMAAEWWAGVEAAGAGADADVDGGGQGAGYLRSGRVQPVPEGGEALARARETTAAELWQGRAEWRVLERGAAQALAGDWLPVSATGLYIHDTLSARISPRLACAALIAAIRAKGGEVLSEGPVQGVQLWATGVADLHEISAARPRLFGTGVKGQAALLRPARDIGQAVLPQLYADSLHMIPHGDGTVAIGSTSERDYDAPGSTDAQLDAVLERAIRAVPALQGAEVLERWAGVRPRSRSRAPVLGRHPLREGFIANGGFKIGFGMAPKVGEVMADLLLEGRDTIPESFRPEASF